MSWWQEDQKIVSPTEIIVEPAAPRSWPTPQDYNESVQSGSNFGDPALRDGQVITNQLGLPRVVSGAFASVYRVHGRKEDWAVRCFLHHFGDQEERYARISDFVCNDTLPYTVSFQFMPEGIRVHGNWFPILKMDWVNGATLAEFVNANASKPRIITALLDSFHQMVADLESNGIAHGDLQHGNIMVLDNHELRLVDYDGMYVPQLAGMMSNELGHPNYQHPSRSATDFGPHLDRFSAWLIHASLYAIAADPQLFETLRGGDECLLLRRDDLRKPEESEKFDVLERHRNKEISQRAKYVRYLLSQRLDEIPPLEDTLPIFPAGELPKINPAKKPKPKPQPQPQRHAPAEPTEQLWQHAPYTAPYTPPPQQSLPAWAISNTPSGTNLTKVCLFIIAFLVIPICFGLSSNDPTKALRAQIEQQVDFYQDHNDWKHALPYAKQWVELTPNSEEAHGELAYTLARLHDYKAASDEYDRALSLHSNSKACVYLRDKAKWVEIPQKQYLRAYNDLSTYMGRHSDNTTALLARAEAARGLKRYDLAADDLLHATHVKPNQASYALNLAKAYYDGGREGDADNVMSTYIRNHTNDPMAWFNRASLFQDDPKYYQRSLDDYNEAVQLTEDPAIRNDVLYNRAGIKTDLHEYALALDDMNLYCKKVPSDADGYARRAWIYGEMHRFKEALHDWRTAANLAPNDARIWADISWVNLKLKNYSAAMDAAEEAVKLDASYAQGWRKLAFSYYHLDRYANALQAVNKSLALDPASSEATHLRSAIQQRMKH